MFRFTRQRSMARVFTDGFFFDEGTQELLVEENVIHDVSHDDVRFNQNKREDQSWTNNIFEDEGGDITSEPAQRIINAAGPSTSQH